MSERTPNWKTTVELNLSREGRDTKVLPSNSCVRPIEFQYIPEHIKERWPFFDAKTHFFCYTHWGIYPIAKHFLRES